MPEALMIGQQRPAPQPGRPLPSRSGSRPPFPAICASSLPLSLPRFFAVFFEIRRLSPQF
jgi:hypothetical protein